MRINATRRLRRERAQADPALKLVRAFAAPGACMMDLGAGIGTYCLEARRHYDSIWAVEPNPALYEDLVTVMGYGDRVLNATLAQKTGSATFRIPLPRDSDWHTRSDVASMVTDLSSRDVLIPAIALDELALGRLDLLRVHLEDGALAALQGGRSTIDRHRPACIIACEPGSAEQALLFSWFDDLGYHGFHIDGGVLRQITRTDTTSSMHTMIFLNARSLDHLERVSAIFPLPAS